MVRSALHVALLLALSFALCGGGKANAQAIDWLASRSGVVISHDPGSARLDGMGTLAIAVADEGRELNLSDYGGNLAAFLWDSDGRCWDAWSRSGTRLVDVRDASGERTRTRTTLVESGLRAAWRKTDRRVLGVDLDREEVSETVERDVTEKMRGPWWGGFGAQRIGPLVVGGGLHFTADNQDIETQDVFAIRHRSHGIRVVGSVAYDGGPLRLGLQTERQVNSITGLSHEESRFHEDKFTWKRPASTYDGAAVWTLSNALKGAVRARVLRLDGRQEAKVSWSNRMPDNPGRAYVLLRAPTFAEEIRGYEIGSRWEVVPLRALRVAAEGAWGHAEDKVREGENFKGSRRTQDETDGWFRAGAGSSYGLAEGRLRLGLEGWFLREVHKEKQIEGDLEVTARALELRTGAEWYPRQNFVLRCGYIRSAVDKDRDLPRTLLIGNALTVGAGYTVHGGLYAIDAAIRIQSLDPDYGGNPAQQEYYSSGSIGVRVLL